MVSRLTINTNSLNVPWQLGTQYRVALDADVVKEPSNNKKGNPAVNNLVTFTTNATAPTLSSSSPANDSFDVVNNTSILLTFNRNVEAGTGNIRLYEVVVGGADQLLYTYNMGDPAFVTFSNTTVTLKTTGFLEANSAYYLVFDSTAIRDIDNFNYAGSRPAKTVTANGNAAINTSVTKWTGVDSIQFDGVGDYLSVPSSADFGYGTGSFIIEAWVYRTASGVYQILFDHRNTATDVAIAVAIDNLNRLYCYVNGAIVIQSSTTITANSWTFVQVARFSGVTRLYQNGAQVGSNYTDSNNYAARAFRIGADHAGTYGFTGYMSDIRILKAPISLGGMPTRSRTNDAYTVLYVQGGVGDVNSTIFFDTQEEALGFPSLSANLSGAFAPTLTVKRTARGQIVMASSVIFTATAKKIKYGIANMSSTFTILAEVSDILKVFTTMTTNILRIRPGFSSVSSSFSTDYPTPPFVDQTNGYTTTFLPSLYPDGPGTVSRAYIMSDYPGHSRIVSSLTATTDFANYYVNSGRTTAIGGSTDGQGDTVIFAEYSSGIWNKIQTITEATVNLSAVSDSFGDAVSLDDSGVYAVATGYKASLSQSQLITFSKSAGVWDVNQTIVSPVNLFDVVISGNGLIMVTVTAEYLNIYTRSSNTWSLSKQYNNTGFYNVSVSSNGNVIAVGESYSTKIYTKSGADWTLTASLSTPQRLSNAGTVSDGVGPIAINRAGNRVIRNSERFMYVYDLIAGPGWTEVSRIRYSNSFLPPFTPIDNDYTFFLTNGSTGFTSTDSIVHLKESTIGPLITFTQIP